MTRIADQRLLALDVHPRYAGVAIFEGPDRLVDWGMLHYGDGNTATSRSIAAQIARLFSRNRPERLVITMPANQTLAGHRLAAVDAAITAVAAKRHIPVRRLSRIQVLDILGANTRYAAALQVAEHFPDLGARLPRRRKIWQSEQARMSIFDAAAAGLAYIRRYSRSARRSDPFAA